jgi:hypothetical protein
MMHKLLTGLLLIVILITASCTANIPFPTGRFESEKVRDVEYQFNDDGTFILYFLGNEYLAGEYSVEGKKFYIEDIDDASVCETTATYEWSYDGEALYFEAIEEDCAPRRGNFNKKTWKLAE